VHPVAAAHTLCWLACYLKSPVSYSTCLELSTFKNVWFWKVSPSSFKMSPANRSLSPSLSYNCDLNKWEIRHLTQHATSTVYKPTFFLQFIPLYYYKLVVVARLGPVTLMCLLCSEDCSVSLSNELKKFIRHMGFEFFCLPVNTTYNEIITRV
jgi:hypothetical protein